MPRPRISSSQAVPAGMFPATAAKKRASPKEPPTGAAQGHWRVGHERRHLSEQALDTYHVFLYGTPLGALGGASFQIADCRLQIADCRFQISDFRLQIVRPVARNQRRKQAHRPDVHRDRGRREDKDKEFYLFPLCDLCALRVNYLFFGRSSPSSPPDYRQRSDGQPRGWLGISAPASVFAQATT